MKMAGYAAVFLGGLIVSYLFISLGVVDVWDGVPGAQQEPDISLPTYLSFVSVMMTAVTVVLAAIAIFIGIVAAYTFNELTNRAEQAAQKRADAALSDAVIIARIDEIAFRHLRKHSLSELESGFDPSDTTER